MYGERIIRDIWGKSPTEEDYKQAESMGVDRETVNKRIVNQGWKLKRAITEPMPGKPRPEFYAIMQELGISDACYRERRKRGLSEREAATRPPKKKFEKNEEYLKWEVIAEKNGINKQNFKVRVIKRGLSLEEAATEPIVPRSERGLRSAESRRKNSKNNKATTLKVDKRGSRANDPYYHKAKEIALANGITIGSFKNRLQNGWTYEMASTVPMNQPRGRKKKEAK